MAVKAQQFHNNIIGLLNAQDADCKYLQWGRARKYSPLDSTGVPIPTCPSLRVLKSNVMTKR